METNVLVKVMAATIVVVTNWTSIGTFIDRGGRQYDVLQSSVQTNWVGKMEALGQSVEHVFKSDLGPTNNTLKLYPKATLISWTNTTESPPMPMHFVISTNQ